MEGDLPSGGASISETLERQETYEGLSTILQTLSEPHRIVITLKYVEGMGNAQIADFLEVSPSVVSSRLKRARKQLQNHMLAKLEAGFPRPDFVEQVCRQIQSCRPLIGVGLNFSASHGQTHLCNCAFRAQSLAKQTEGICQEYPGKGLVIWYGMHRIREDDAIRAIQTALELQKQSCPAGTFYLCIRQILDNEIGNRSQFPCLIEVDEDFLEPSEILADSSIAWLLRHKFHFEVIQRSEITLAASVYKLTLNPSVDTPDMDILVGRDAEVAQLEEAIEHLLAGGSGIIHLTGEAGIGKTHLLRALRKSYERNTEVKSLIWLQGKANPGEGHQPIRVAIQSHFGFESADELREHLVSLGLEDALPYFAELLRLPFESSDKKFNGLTVEQIHYRTFQYLRDWLLKLAEEAPVVWVIDDTHWLSPESSRLLQYLCRTTKNAPILFLFSRRSGYEQVAEAKYGIELEKQVAQRYPEAYQEIDLAPLPEWASRSLLFHFLGNRKLLPSESSRVLELAGGNPFYLREIAQLLLDAPDSMSIPTSLERLILAHLELLPPLHQNLLRYASVLGSHVDGNLLQAAFPQVELSKMCEQLQGIGWLQPAKEIALVWRHDLYRESIYNSIESNVQRQLHAEIAQQLDGYSKTLPDVLADHYEAADNPEKAAHYAFLAVEMYHERRQHLRVRRYAEMALSYQGTLSQEQHIEFLRHYAEALGKTGHPSEAIPHLEEALSLASTDIQRILINMKLADCYFDQRGVALREKALSLIYESTETGVIIKTCSMLPRIDLTPKPDVVLRVLQLAQKRKEGKAEALVLRLLALAQTAAGASDDAWSTIQRAIQMTESQGNNELLAEVELVAGTVLWEGFKSLKALNHLNRSLHLLEQREKHAYHTLQRLGTIYYDSGQYEAMTEVFQNILDLVEPLKDASIDIRDALSYLVEGYAYQENWEKAYHYFWQLLDNVDSHLSDSSFDVEAATGALCHGDKPNHRWIWEDVPHTMARAQELIRRFHERGITAEDNYKLLGANLHPILAAGYVEYGVKRSHEEGVAMIRLFARQVWILDEHVEFWAYLTGILDYNRLEGIFADALEQVEHEETILPNETSDRPEFFVSTHPEKVILKWLRSCLRELYEADDAGKHLKQMGIVPEPCWLVTGTFEENVPAEVEQEILGVVFNPENKSRTGSLPVKIEWRTPDDFRDGYIDCRHIFQTMDRISAYACTSILSLQEQQVKFTAYHDDSICIWLNGELCFEEDHCCYSQFDGVLQPGYNPVLIRLTNYEDGWGFILRVTDRDGEVLEDLTYTQPHLSNGVALGSGLPRKPPRQAPLRQLSPQRDDATEDKDATGDSDSDNPTQVPLGLSHWAKAYSGVWEETSEGLKVYGTAYRGGNSIFSKSFYNFRDSELLVKWMPNGGDGYNYAHFHSHINRICRIGGMTHHPHYLHDTRIYDNTWYYTRIKINTDRTYAAIMSTGDYDINGGLVVRSDSGTISDDVWEYIEKTNIRMAFGDNYAGTSAYMIIAEVKTDAIPVKTTILSSYDFEDAVDVPAEFNFKGNWVIDTVGFNSSKSLHNTNSPSSISLKVTDVASVSFKIKCSGPYLSKFRFSVDGVIHFAELCRQVLDEWNEVIMPIAGTGTQTLKWSSVDGTSLWIDGITIYTLDNGT